MFDLSTSYNIINYYKNFLTVHDTALVGLEITDRAGTLLDQDEDLAIKHNDNNPEQGQFESEEHIIFHTDTSWVAEVKQFFDSILNNIPVALGSSQDALCLMQAMDRIYANR